MRIPFISLKLFSPSLKGFVLMKFSNKQDYQIPISSTNNQATEPAPGFPAGIIPALEI